MQARDVRRVQASRVRGEVEVFEVGVSGGAGVGELDDVQIEDLPMPQEPVGGEEGEAEGGGDGSSKREEESLWRIILKLFLGMEFEDEYRGGEVMVV